MMSVYRTHKFDINLQQLTKQEIVVKLLIKINSETNLPNSKVPFHFLWVATFFLTLDFNIYNSNPCFNMGL